MRAHTSIGLVLGSLVAICCSAGQNQSTGNSRVSSTPPDAGSASSLNDASVPYDAGKPPDLNTGDGSMTTTATDDRPVPTCTTNCMDFPATPVMDTTAPTAPPANAAALFGAANNMGTSGACVLEPQLAQGTDPGALFPANWLRPRFRFQPLAGENLWEIRLHADAEANDFVVYTTSTTYALPKDVWTALANNVHMAPITVTIRGVNTAAPGKPSGTTGSFQIAPVYAGGSLVYWASTSPAINPDTSKLVGFHVGDESVIDALTIPQVQRQIIAVDGTALRVSPDPGAIKNPPGAVQCIGCHTSTPDGNAVAFTDLWPWNGVVASIQANSVGQQPAYVTPGAAVLINQPWLGMLSFSKSQWTDGMHLAVSAYGGRTTDVGFSLGSATTPKTTIAWFNLDTTANIPWTAGMPGPTNAAIASAEKTAWGRLALKGETASVVSPAFSHDGKNVFYTSADVEQDGRIGTGNADVNIHVVPFNGGAGGTVAPVAGASEPGVAEYYPSLSVDDTLLAFNRVSPIDAAAIYYRADGEINVIPAAGGTATRLAANDPPACGMQKSPGVINSWPKWSPDVESDSGKNYYWLIFSSARAYPGQFMMDLVPGISPPDRRSSQLYMAAVVEDTTTHEFKTFSGVYLWNQGAMTTNLTPAWDEFKIPPVPPPK
jgi:hypothetical protein